MKYCVGHKVHLDFYVRCYGKTWINVVANPILHIGSLVQVSPSSMIEGWSSTQELSKYMEEYLDLWKINHTTGGYFLLLVFCPPSSMKWLSNKAFFHLGFSEPSYIFAMCSYNMESRNVYHISDIRLETSHIFMYNIPCTFISDIYFNSSNSSIPTLIHWGINEYQKDFLHRQ